MPAPYVIVGVAVVSFAAVLAFKEFVYDPHLAPKFDEFLERRRQRQRQQRQEPVGVPARESSDTGSDDSDDDRPLLPRDSEDGMRDADSMSIELMDLRARETAEWRSPNTNGTLRQRNPSVMTSNVLDESNVFLPYNPISPISPAPQSATESSAPSSPFAPRFMTQVSTAPVIHSPSPRTAISTSRLHASVNAETASPSPAAPSAVTSPRMSSPASSARSDSTASSFAPAVVGPSSRAPSERFGSPRSEGSLLFDGARSPTLSGSSPARSRVVSPFVSVPRALPAVASPAATDAFAAPSLPERTVSPLSPFSDIHSLGFRSPSPVFLSPQPSSMHLTAESRTAVLSPSLRSGMFSPSMSSVDDQFDVASFDGSDFDSWSSVGRRTPSPGLGHA
ncbi:hypothetical protein PsYK624_033860 [Phanerochaete sordida]|uniref:Uncharacterized protein n=1 Tax=Phanerochaete sordida TaxID=48140 RepID=A0A9P3G1I9_9APHY|nr:hypothetical protein PsYK624_033860 [Phanerochaete sordida]